MERGFFNRKKTDWIIIISTTTISIYVLVPGQQRCTSCLFSSTGAALCSHVAHSDVRVKHGVQVGVFVSRSPTQLGHNDDKGKEADHSQEKEHEDPLLQRERLSLRAQAVPAGKKKQTKNLSKDLIQKPSNPSYDTHTRIHAHSHTTRQLT